MSQPKVVLFNYAGRSVPALVLAERFGETSHLGKDGEPILTLALIDPARETGLSKDADGEFVYPIGRLPNVFIEHDVVHASHEFDEEFLRKHGSSQAQIASQRGHGEWSDAIGDAIEIKQNEIDAQRQRADLAESLVASLRKELEEIKTGSSDPTAE